MDRNFYTPPEVLSLVIESGIKKANLDIVRQLLLAFLAGVFIAFASEGSNMAAYNLFANPDTFGIGKFIAGVVFGTGLMLVVIAGGELFTGNTLIAASVFDKKVRIRAMLLNWAVVYLGNFIGSVFIAYMMYKSNLFNSSAGLLGGMTIKIAYNKVSMPFMSAIFLGIMCNWLVCLAVWTSTASKDIAGKALMIFFVIGLFITSSFEHSIANMYYIPAGIMAKSNADWVLASGLSAEQLLSLNWWTFIKNNLLPVTIGNIIGGSGFVAGIYYFVYKGSMPKAADK